MGSSSAGVLQENFILILLGMSSHTCTLTSSGLLGADGIADLFPLPVVPARALPSVPLSRGTRQRLVENHVVFSRAAETAETLNQLHGSGGRASLAEPTVAQLAALRSISDAHRVNKPPCDLETPEEAARQLLRVGHSYSGDAPSTLVNFELDRVSLPLGSQLRLTF